MQDDRAGVVKKYVFDLNNIKKAPLFIWTLCPGQQVVTFTDFAPHASPCCTDYRLSQSELLGSSKYELSELLGSSKYELSGWRKLPNRPWTALKKIFRCWRSIAPKTIEQINRVSRRWVLEMSPNDATSPRACWSNPCSRQPPAIDLFALFFTRIPMLICSRIFPWTRR
jgi:hypothetical protein